MSFRNPLQEKLRQLDLQLKKNMVGIKPLHHSTGDWDYSDALWLLDAVIFVSAPSSLKYPSQVPTKTLEVKVKTATVPIAYVKEGQIVTWWRLNFADVAVYNQIIFRWQDANNYYAMRMNAVVGVDTYIYRVKTGVSTTLWSGNTDKLPINTWKQVRVTWWNDYVGIVIRLEVWDGAAWEWIIDAYDVENNWQAIGGRVGFNLCSSGTSHWLDDTDIYGIPP